ncbi:Para-hydroxybenzoate--polyprenyltransferase, mitochondrial precursor (PHB:polyprenyltransferase) [Nowakowskiella sp. JEL0407]|nr:Para-hydroxybenzoate--polyprenyltransferase, mitochondrial precursor (PHB:polyprenyltransferase) [Nowakowskiella sp. JEL0407]
MRGAGCTVNDLWDRDIDVKVERTRSRPLAAGAVTPFKAVAFLGLQLVGGLAVLTQLNTYSIALGASSLFLVATYPLMKRITYWPQAVLGLTFNWGALLGWSAILGYVPWETALPLYCGGALWTLYYDTVYALQDKADDITAGVKSTALLFGDNVKTWLYLFATGSVLCWSTALLINGNHVPVIVAGVGAAGAHMFWQISKLNVVDPKSALQGFKSAPIAALFIFGAVALDCIYVVYFEKGGEKQHLKERSQE